MLCYCTLSKARRPTAIYGNSFYSSSPLKVTKPMKIPGEWLPTFWMSAVPVEGITSYYGTPLFKA